MGTTFTHTQLVPMLAQIDRALESLDAGTNPAPAIDLETAPSGDRPAADEPRATSVRSVINQQKNASRPREDRSLAFALAAEHRARLCWFIGTSAGAEDPDALTYERYCGLREKPFSLSSDPRFFFSRSSHGLAFDALVAGIRRREGILALTGEVGTGKTTLCRAVLHSLNRKAFAAFVPDPFLSREDLLKTLLVDFGIVSADDIRAGRLRGATRTDLSYPLYDFLLSLQSLNALAVVMIDEAQNLSSELLEEIRILSDLEGKQKLIEVFLIGQPELQSRLATPEMRQLNQRVVVRHELSPLQPEEVRDYVTHRLSVAGNDGRVQFVDEAIDLVFASAQGIPRVINLICDRALGRAADMRTTIVGAEHVVWAVADLKLPGMPPLRSSNGPQPEAVSDFEPERVIDDPVQEAGEPEQAPPGDDPWCISDALMEPVAAPVEIAAASPEAQSPSEVSASLGQANQTESVRGAAAILFVDEGMLQGRRTNWRRLAALGAWLVLAMGFAGKVLR